jgi:hypothetical protein
MNRIPEEEPPLDAELQAARDWLKRMAAEPDEEQLIALRSSVLRAVSRPKPILWPYVVAAAAVVAIALLLVSRHSVQEPAPRLVAAVGQMPIHTLVPIGLGPLPLRVRRATRRHTPAMTLLANQSGDPVIKLRTSDPSVVVLWVMNTTPEEGNSNE